jgi:hypothetical protein
MSRFI